jgi:hypothetical protein
MSSPLNPVSPIAPAMQETVVQQQEQPAMDMQSIPATPAPTATTTTQETTQTPTALQAPKGKELVPGFGIVLSLEILNKPMQIQEIQLNDALAYQQELPYELKGNQGILLELLSENAIISDFWSISTARWDSLRRYNDLQPSYSGD